MQTFENVNINILMTIIEVNCYKKDGKVISRLSSLDIRSIFGRARSPEWNLVLSSCGYSQEWFEERIQYLFGERFNKWTYTRKSVFSHKDAHIISLCLLWCERYKEGDHLCTKSNFQYLRESFGDNEKTISQISKDYNLKPIEYFNYKLKEAYNHGKIPSRKYTPRPNTIYSRDSQKQKGYTISPA